jgi:hypothetical protein
MTSQNDTDPFDKLFDDNAGADFRDLLADTVLPFIRFSDRAAPEIVFTLEGEKLTAKEKLLVFLLGRKILFVKGYVPLEGIGPGDIEKATRIPGGTIRPRLRDLVDEKLVRIAEAEGGYLVPNSRVRQISDMLRGKSKPQ